VKLFVNFFEPFDVHMSVYLGGSDTCMAEHFLHLAKICSPSQKVGSKTMPQGMGADLGSDPHAEGVPLHQLPNPFAA
jgi:hypothetical protein